MAPDESEIKPETTNPEPGQSQASDSRPELADQLPEETAAEQAEGLLEDREITEGKELPEAQSETEEELQAEALAAEIKEELVELQAQKPATQRRIPWLLIALGALVPVIFALGLGTGYLIWGRDATSSPKVEIPENLQRFDVPIDDDPVYGRADAPITLIVFADYECPYCKSWHEETWLRLKKKFAKKVRLVYRDFPLPSHPNAIPAAEAANCAGEQGKYWEYHDLLYQAADGLGDTAYQKYAQQLNLDMVAFQVCRQEGRYQAEITADYQYASELGISSTPTFFLNGIPIVGAYPYDFFRQIIDLELKGKIP